MADIKLNVKKGDLELNFEYVEANENNHGVVNSDKQMVTSEVARLIKDLCLCEPKPQPKPKVRYGKD